MSSENRWSISELIARYELEPELVDVFVEGTFDRDVLAQSVPHKNGGPSFYEIDSVDVPLELLHKYGLTSGNKQRVIALAQELSGLPPEAKVSCLVDRDLDHWFGEVVSTVRLRWTKYCSLENHFLTSSTMADVVLTTARAKIRKFETLANSLLEVLRQLYALRLADKELALNLKWVALKKYLYRNGDTIGLDADKYIIAILGGTAKLGRRPDFDASHKLWLQKLQCDIRMAARGHDYTFLLAWVISEFDGQRELATEGAVERLFVLLARSVESIPAEIQ